MFDILLSQLGIKPGDLKAMADMVTRNVQEGNARLARIEEKLGITEPLAIPGRSDDDA